MASVYGVAELASTAQNDQEKEDTGKNNNEPGANGRDDETFYSTKTSMAPTTTRKAPNNLRMCTMAGEACDEVASKN